MKMVKKILFMILLIVMSISYVNAIEISSNQDDNLADFYKNQKGNTMVNNVAGSINEAFISSTNNTYYYDVSYEFEETNEAYYLIIQNAEPENNTIQIMYRGDLNLDPQLYIQNFTLTERGRYYFKFTPSTIGEVSKVYIDFQDDFASTIRYVENKPRSFNTLVGGFVTGLEEVMEINIGLWKVSFYTFILLISVSFIFLIFYIAFKVFEFSKKLKDDDGMVSSTMPKKDKGDK